MNAFLQLLSIQYQCYVFITRGLFDTNWYNYLHFCYSFEGLPATYRWSRDFSGLCVTSFHPDIIADGPSNSSQIYNLTDVITTNYLCLGEFHLKLYCVITTTWWPPSRLVMTRVGSWGWGCSGGWSVQTPFTAVMMCYLLCPEAWACWWAQWTHALNKGFINQPLGRG